MQVGAWYKFVNQKDENVNPTLKTTVADPGRLFLQVEKLISQKPLEVFLTPKHKTERKESKIVSIKNSEKLINKSEIRQTTKGT